MRRWKYLGILLVATTATGCATNSHRTTTDSVMTRTGPFSKTAAPKQTQVALPPEAPDIFQAAQATNQRGLLRYFPGLARKGGDTSPTKTLSHPGHNPAQEPVIAEVVTNPPARTSLFSMRKPRAPQSYSTDARPTIAARSTAEPSILPVALQLPAARADNAVTPTSANVADEPAKADDRSAGHDPVPANPAASDAVTQPLSTTEPQLAIDPITPPTGSTPPVADSAPEPAATPSPTTGHEAGPQATPDTPAVDPRERPRLSSDYSIAPPVPETNPEAGESKPAAVVASTQPAESAAKTEAIPDPSQPSSAPSVADPNHSLGLPAATVPTSYYRHDSVAVRGSYQAPEPPPVLASPQYAASPQSSGASHSSGHKAWQRPSFLRLVRKMTGGDEPTSTQR